MSIKIRTHSENVTLAQQHTSNKIKEKKIQNSKKKNRRIVKTRKQRGYNWEDTLVKRFNTLKGWKAFRLGSPSVALPDILVINNEKSTIFTIEAKSGTGTTLQVPFDQILRCVNWKNTFEIYNNRKVLLAFKFLSKKRIGVAKYENRELREFYKIWAESEKVADCVCTYDGKTYGVKNRKRTKLHLDEYQMPFKSKHRILL